MINFKNSLLSNPFSPIYIIHINSFFVYYFITNIFWLIFIAIRRFLIMDYIILFEYLLIFNEHKKAFPQLSEFCKPDFLSFCWDTLT